MEAGIQIAEWFANEAERVYHTFKEKPEDRERRKLVEWISAKGGSATARDLSRDPRKYRKDETGKGDAAACALEGLVTVGLGEWKEEPPGPKGGPGRRVFHLLRGGDGDTTSPDIGEKGGDKTPSTPVAAGVATGDVPNMIATLLFAPRVLRATRDYFERVG